MLVWMISGISAVSGLRPVSDAARVGHAIGATIGFSMILSLWVMGDIILGLFVLLTRGDKVIVEETAYGGGRGADNERDPAGADDMIARYMQRQNTPRVPTSSVSAPQGFGRRR